MAGTYQVVTTPFSGRLSWVTSSKKLPWWSQRSRQTQ